MRNEGRLFGIMLCAMEKDVLKRSLQEGEFGILKGSRSMTIRSVFAVAALLCAVACSGVEWNGFSDENWYSGRKLDVDSLRGKVVMVDEWGAMCGPCISLLPRMQEIWNSFKTKPFVLLGSHRQGRNAEAVAELVKKHGLTYPIYQGAGLVGEPDNGGGVPFIYVVDARGKVVYSGRNDRDALGAVVNALSDMPSPTDLCGGVTPVKFKSLARQLVLGRSCEGAVRQLKSAAKGSDAKAKEAAALLKAIGETHDALKEDMERLQTRRPAAALAAMTKFRQTWPSEAKECDAKYKELAADPDVAKCAKARAALDAYRDFDPKTPYAAKKALADVKGALAALASLDASKNAAVAKEARIYAEELKDCEKALEAASARRARR